MGVLLFLGVQGRGLECCGFCGLGFRAVGRFWGFWRMRRRREVEDVRVCQGRSFHGLLEASEPPAGRILSPSLLT